jgi:CBS domain-containing protein
MLRLRDIMTTDVLTLSPDTSLRDAAEQLVARHVGGAPVVEGDRVVGVVSATDILGFLASPPAEVTDRSSERESERSDDADEWEDDEPSGDDDPSEQFLAAQWSAASADVAEALDDAAGGDADPFVAYTVADVMTRSVLAMQPAVDVWTAVAHMHEADVHRLLVMEGDALLGVVSTTDVARSVSDGRLVRRTFVFDRPRSSRGA